MNFDEMAREIAIAVRGIAHKHLSDRYRSREERGMDYKVCIETKLKELLPVPEDLEAAIEKILFVSGHFPRCDLKDGEFRSFALDRCVKRILTETVALLLTSCSCGGSMVCQLCGKTSSGTYKLTPEQLASLEESYTEVKIIATVAEIDERIKDLLEQNQYANDLCAERDEQIKRLKEENEQQRDFINYVDDCYFLWSKRQVHVQPHFYSGWLVDRPMFVSILEEAKESPDED